MVRVVHFKKSPYDVYIGRPSEWGNPFKEGEDGTRHEIISKYEIWLRAELKSNSELVSRLLELDGKVLGCWCKPKPCHGDIIVKIINELKLMRLVELY